MTEREWEHFSAKGSKHAPYRGTVEVDSFQKCDPTMTMNGVFYFDVMAQWVCVFMLKWFGAIFSPPVSTYT